MPTPTVTLPAALDAGGNVITAIPMVSLAADGSIVSGGGGGGGGDASAANQTAQLARVGTTGDAAVTDPTATATQIALAKGNLALLGALTETAPATDTASSGQNGRLQRIAQRLTSLIGLLPTALGTRSAATSLAVALSTEDTAKLGLTPVGSSNLAVASVTVTGVSGSPTLIVAARTGAMGTGRVSVTIINEGTTALRLSGASNATVGINLPGVVGASATFNTTSAIYGFVASGSAALSILENF